MRTILNILGGSLWGFLWITLLTHERFPVVKWGEIALRGKLSKGMITVRFSPRRRIINGVAFVVAWVVIVLLSGAGIAVITALIGKD